ncbi:hypothetical protein GGH92_010850 [Coemansia sp. RSA 2673]|nr:hypothetical protein GGH92_010850 [Coemansia sp. RSA 2673]
MVYNLQHGYFGSSAQKSDPHMLSTAKKTKRSGGAYSGHGISSSDTFNLSGASYLPQSTADYSSSLATSGPGTTTKPPRI